MCFYVRRQVRVYMLKFRLLCLPKLMQGQSTKRRIESVIRSNAPAGSAPGQYVGGYGGGMAGTFGKAARGIDVFGNPSPAGGAPPRCACVCRGKVLVEGKCLMYMPRCANEH